MLYYGIHKRYNQEDLENVHVLALSHHFIICKYLMPNFQVEFVRAVVQHWKNLSLQAVPFSRNSGYMISILMFSQLVDLAIAKTSKVIFWP